MTLSTVNLRRLHLPALLGFLALTLGIGFLGGFLGGSGGYEELTAPPLAPSGIVFPIVWVILYVLMGIAAYLVWKADELERGRALTWYLVQLIIGALWPIVFFRFGWRLFGFFWILLLIAVFSITLTGFRFLSKPAFRLMLPTLFWLIFAAYLNLGFYLLNA